LPSSERVLPILKYLAILIPSFLVIQWLLILMHEFTHSTVAWLLNDMHSPLDIVWGNPVMMTGWDEGVGYKKLVADGLLRDEALIGVSPLIMHSIMVTICIWLMLRDWMLEKKWLFHGLFWFAVTNFMELIAYIPMRGFSSHGDTGHFNHGLQISPWFLFILGSLALGLALFILYKKVLPRLWQVFAPDNRALQWTILAMMSFILFFWGSGLRVMFYVYPDPQWTFGLMAFPLSGLALYWFRPPKQAKTPK
jgi:hypothetical protein